MEVNVLVQVMNVIMWTVLVLVISGLGFLFYYFITFNIKVRIREVINNRKIIKDYRARVFKDSSGIEWLKLFRGRKIEMPSDDAFELNSKGKKIVEFWKYSDNSLIPVVDDKQSFGNSKGFTTNQRSLLINELKKAQERKGRGWKELLLPLASMSALLILVVCLMVFWGDLAKPLLEMGGKLESFQDKQIEQQELLNEIIRDYQVIDKSKVVIKDDGVPLG